MGNLAIKAEVIGKQYRIGGKQQGYQTFRDALKKAVTAPFRRLATLSGRAGSANEMFWALKDVSFQVNHGEVLGIIGRNGSGKTTLLKILSRITEPTEGNAELYGRVGSLLEVGTGFHPELTGRENIFLSGAVLGMKKAEIDRKFDEIVSFAGTEQFLDTPIKRYSSGMQVRLAFAVAAHLDPEILLVDEVLAVGDADFQKKCLGRMNEITTQGRTVLLVSHQMPAIQSLADRAILLVCGTIGDVGDPATVIGRYLSDSLESAAAVVDVSDSPGRTRGTEPAIREVWLEDDEGMLTSEIATGAPLTICFKFDASRPISMPHFCFGVDDVHGRRLFSADNCVMAPTSSCVESSRAGIVKCRFPSLPLAPGDYYVTVSLVESQTTIIDSVERAIRFTVQPSDFYGSGKSWEPSHGPFWIHASITLGGNDQH